MKSYLQKLKAYVKANPTRFDDDCPLPALDSLYWHYTECHTMTNKKTKQAKFHCLPALPATKEAGCHLLPCQYPLC